MNNANQFNTHCNIILKNFMVWDLKLLSHVSCLGASEISSLNNVNQSLQTLKRILNYNFSMVYELNILTVYKYFMTSQEICFEEPFQNCEEVAVQVPNIINKSSCS